MVIRYRPGRLYVPREFFEVEKLNTKSIELSKKTTWMSDTAAYAIVFFFFFLGRHYGRIVRRIWESEGKRIEFWDSLPSQEGKQSPPLAGNLCCSFHWLSPMPQLQSYKYLPYPLSNRALHIQEPYNHCIINGQWSFQHKVSDLILIQKSDQEKERFWDVLAITGIIWWHLALDRNGQSH